MGTGLTGEGAGLSGGDVLGAGAGALVGGAGLVVVVLSGGITGGVAEIDGPDSDQLPLALVPAS